MSRFIFALCDIFLDIINVIAIKWLNKFDYEMKDYQNNENRFSFMKYFNYFNMLLIEDVIKWFEKDLNVRRFLIKAKIVFIYIIVDNFQIVFCEVFSLKEVEIEDLFILFEIKLVELY